MHPSSTRPLLLETKRTLREWVVREKRGGKTIGLVPTMGYLHEGHASLMRRARSENDRVVVSIYVNPLQFGPSEDFAAYPRDLAGDLDLCAGAGVDAVFHTSDDQMYAPDFSTYVIPDALASNLCGASRPGHFRGVCTVVAKLFNLASPDRAYFGQKDCQQVAVLARLARDLDFPLEFVVCPTVREPDGLAMSSRNKYLSPAERETALVLWRSLALARDLVKRGESDAAQIQGAMRALYEGKPGLRTDYIELVDPGSLAPVSRIAGKTLVAVAAFVGKTRLIDNEFVAP
ncbi:MAG: pantoate--beta-alanine ligase [Planctomycetes bacterium]|nr:pantoate--beta-alanine ligase [Planctomycetota bacterium]